MLKVEHEIKLNANRPHDNWQVLIQLIWRADQESIKFGPHGPNHKESISAHLNLNLTSAASIVFSQNPDFCSKNADISDTRP